MSYPLVDQDKVSSPGYIETYERPAVWDGEKYTFYVNTESGYLSAYMYAMVSEGDIIDFDLEVLTPMPAGIFSSPFEVEINGDVKFTNDLTESGTFGFSYGALSSEDASTEVAIGLFSSTDPSPSASHGCLFTLTPRTTPTPPAQVWTDISGCDQS